MEFRSSSFKLYGFAAVMLALAIASIVIVTTGNGPEQALGVAGILLFGGCSIFAVRRAMRNGGRPTLTLSSEGFRDIRFDDAFVPWSAVKEVTSQKIGRHGLTILVVPFDTPVEGFDREKWSGGLSKLFGTERLSIDPYDLEGGADYILEMFKRHHQAYGRQFGRR